VTRREVLGLGLLAAAAWPRAVRADARRWVVDGGRSKVGFHAVSRLMNAEGRFGRVSGDLRLDPDQPEGAQARVAVEVATLETGIGMRDDHLRSPDFLDAARHPQATFVATSARADGDRLQVAGQLTIRGVTRPVTVPVTVRREGSDLHLVGEVTVLRREFGVAYDSFLNPIRDPVRITFDLIARPE
jgi:polyisoprenoid-binding protein YceI